MQNELQMNMEALKLARAGYVVMPCIGKVPLKNFNWKFLQTAESINEQKVKRWFVNHKYSNIAIVTGVNLFVIDADTDEAVKWVEDNLPETNAVSITGKGKHYIWRAPDFEIANSVNRKLGLDIRGKNGYIVAPPSMHETGRRYAWEKGFIELKDVPQFPQRDWGKLYEGTENKALERFLTKTSIIVNDKPKIKDFKISEKSYRDLLPLYEKLKSILHKTSSNGQDSIKACCPSHSDNNPSFTMTLSTSGNIIMNCFSGCSFEAICNSLNIKPEDCFKIPPQKQDGYEVKNLDTDEILSKIQIGEEEDKLEDLIANDEDLKIPMFPDEFLRPPGLIGELCDYINETSIRHQPLLALGASLCAIGTLFGRKVQTTNGTRTNIYCIGVAKTGGGKENARKKIKKCFKVAGTYHKYMGGEQFASDTGILVEIKKKPSVLYQIDEFGKYFKSLIGKNSASHLSGIITLLMSIYEKADDTFTWKQYADEKREQSEIEQPNVCLYGTTVSNNFWDGFTKEQAIDGFINRLLIFQSDEVPEISEDIQVGKQPPQSIIEAFVTADQMPVSYSDNLNIEIPDPKVLPYTDEANKIFKQYRSKVEKMCRSKAGEDDTVKGAMFRRVANIVETVALIIAAGKFDDFIDDECVRYAIGIVDNITNIMYYNVNRSVADNENEKNVLKILSMIKGCGRKGLTKSQLIRSTQMMNKATREDVIQTLIEGEQIIAATKKSGGPKPVHMFFAHKGWANHQ